MIRRILVTLSVVAIAVAQLVMVTPALAGTQAAPTTYVSPTYGYSLTYDASWQMVSRASLQGVDSVSLFNETSYVLLVGSEAFSGDAAACVSATAEAVTAAPSFGELSPAINTEGEPMTGANATNAYAVYTYTYTNEDGTQEKWALDTQCVILVPGEATLAIVQDVPVAAYNEELPARDALVVGFRLSPNSVGHDPPVCPDGSQPGSGGEGGESISGPDGQDGADGQCGEEGLLEPVPDPAGLKTLVDAVAADVYAFWAAVFAGSITHFRPSIVLVEVPLTTPCGETTSGQNDYFYCPLNQTIYLDSPARPLVVKEVGISAVLYALGQEWAHHVQLQSGLWENHSSVASSLIGATTLEFEAN